MGEVHTADEAVRSIERLRPDLILLDLYLPDLPNLRASRFCGGSRRSGRSRVLLSVSSRDASDALLRSGHHVRVTSRLPALGPRGEGWVAAQLVLFAVLAGAGVRDLAGRLPGEGAGWFVTSVGLAGIAFGAVVAGRGVWDLRASLSPFPRPLAGAPLVDTGAYRLIRHPIYSGLVVAALGWALVTWSGLAIAVAGLLFLLFAGKSRREEAWLAEVHPGYRAYQRRTKRLIPWL